MSLARFVATLEEPLITRREGIEVTMSVKASSLGRVMRLALFTGAGKIDPRQFSIRIVSKSVPGVVCQARLAKLEIKEKGETMILLLLQKPDLKSLQGLIGMTVGVEVVDEREEE